MLHETIKGAAEKFGVPVKMIVIDTLSRALGGGDDGEAKDMGKIVAAADRWKRGTHVAFIHHTGHSNQERAPGSSVLPAAVDNEFAFVKTGDVITMSATKQRDGETGAALLTFRLKPVVIGTDQWVLRQDHVCCGKGCAPVERGRAKR
jgi:hypothetical protein